MKLAVNPSIVFPLAVFSLTACQPGDGGSGNNSEPLIEGTHTTVLSMSDDDSEMDMDLRIRVKLSDPDGVDDLNTAIFYFPNGESYNISIQDRITERNGEHYIYSSYNLSDYSLVNNERQFPMTGYSVLIQDFSGNKVQHDFSLMGVEGEAVPDGTMMVHPDDFSAVGGSGGDYRSAMLIPIVDNVVANADSIDITLTLNDSRIKELEFFFSDGAGNRVAYYWETDAAAIEAEGKKVYTLQASDLKFSEGYSDIAQIKAMTMVAVDLGAYQSGGAFQYTSQLVGFSDKYPGINP